MNSTDQNEEKVPCDQCQSMTAEHELFEFLGYDICPACRKIHTGANPDYERRMEEENAKAEAERKRWKANLRKPLTMTLKKSDKDGVSRLVVRPPFFLYLILFFVLIYYGILLFETINFEDGVVHYSFENFIQKGGFEVLFFIVVFGIFLSKNTILTINNHELCRERRVMFFRWGVSRYPLDEIEDLEIDFAPGHRGQRPYCLYLVMECEGRQDLVTMSSKKSITYIERTLDEILTDGGIFLEEHERSCD